MTSLFQTKIKKADRLWKVHPLLDIRNACLTLPRSPNICVDEQIIPLHRQVPSEAVRSWEAQPNRPEELYLGKP
ncbi:hypothetical protein HPB48_005958 [Haemaphysalis longicornis]|uniref:Transposase n=1 Tax=Haemaphysalis longicornis TaxID=44386 RepID=A0A9J6FKD8_HAELO|nr:hypothetical protein HPB48_005958 [Haemaphysalis longicornis]